MMWNLLAGYGGMVSIGQQAFFGLGGYVLLVLGNFLGVNPFVAVPLAALIAALIALPVSQRGVPPAGRLLRHRHLGDRRGVPPELRQRVGGRRRLGHQPDRAARHREGDARVASRSGCALACAVAVDRAGLLVPAPRHGLALLAIRDSEVASESQGVDVRAHQARGVYLVAAFGAGLAGALYFVGNLRIIPDAAFSVNWTAFAIFMVVIGGIGTHRRADRRRDPVLLPATRSSATTAPGT